MVTKPGHYLTDGKKHTGEPPITYLMPWVEPSDTRYFIKNGELIKPYQVIVFSLTGLEHRSELEHDEARYHEIARREFDPIDCVETKLFDTDALLKSLNDPSQIRRPRFGGPGTTET
jgi:hypothetical protein